MIVADQRRAHDLGELHAGSGVPTPPSRSSATTSRAGFTPVAAFRISERLGLEVSIARASFRPLVRFAGVTSAPGAGPLRPVRLPRPLVLSAHLLPQLERAIACARVALQATGESPAPESPYRQENTVQHSELMEAKIDLEMATRRVRLLERQQANVADTDLTDDEKLDAKAHELLTTDTECKELRARSGFSPAFALALTKADRALQSA
jgi:hypothetical protein